MAELITEVQNEDVELYEDEEQLSVDHVSCY